MITYSLKPRHQSVRDMIGHALTLQTNVTVWNGLGMVLKVRLSAFERGCLAAVALDAADDEEVFRITETVLPARLAGAPTAPWIDIEGEARWWVERASQREKRAWLAACFQSLPENERAGFLAAAKRRATA